MAQDRAGWHPTARGSRAWPDRFWRRVYKTDGCWLWTGSTRSKGYGQVFADGRPQLAHRVAWSLENGPIPDGLVICHVCDNPPCVRPDHLFLGTLSDNTQDMLSKGRGKTQTQAFLDEQAKRDAEGFRTAAKQGSRHGTEYGYDVMGCRDLCCRTAKAMVQRYRKAAGVKRKPAVMEHGAYAMFNAGCQCEICEPARRSYYREAQQRSRARRAGRVAT